MFPATNTPGMNPLRIGVISDTHIPTRAKHLPEQISDLFHGFDAVFHAGDFVDTAVWRQLQELTPATYGVLGNCDPVEMESILPDTLGVEFGGVKIGMIHDSGASSGRRDRMRKAFPGYRVVIFGHSHRPLIEDDGDLLLLNPGSACDPRWAKIPTLATLTLKDGVPEASLIELQALRTG